MSIHPTAIVSPGARFGTGVEIGPYTIIGENVEIGDNAKISAHVFIDGWTTIGKNCNIYPGAVIGTTSQDLKYDGAKNYTVIGDDVLIREYVTINHPTAAEAYTKVGDRVVLLAYAHVAHECVVGDEVIMANAAGLSGHVTVEEGAIIGGLTGIHQFCHIGKYSMVGGASRISMDVLPFTLVAGSPARSNGLNHVGLKRRGFSAEEIAILKKAYRLLFRSGLKQAVSVERIKSELERIPALEHLLDFISKSERGLTR